MSFLDMKCLTNVSLRQSSVSSFVFLFDWKGQKDVYLPVKILDCFKFSKEQYFQGQPKNVNKNSKT